MRIVELEHELCDGRERFADRGRFGNSRLGNLGVGVDIDAIHGRIKITPLDLLPHVAQHHVRMRTI
jgi:hypothetical protein